MLGTFTSAAGILDIPAPKGLKLDAGNPAAYAPKQKCPPTREQAGRRWKNPVHEC